MNCLSQRKKFKNKHPVWVDSTDELGLTVSLPDEREDEEDKSKDDDRDGSTSESEDDDYDMFANDVRSKRLTLENKELKFKHLTNLNNDRSFNGIVKQVEFNPKARVSLVSLSRGQVDLYEVDGERNRYIQNIKLPHTKTPFCLFNPDGDSIVISSESYRGSFYLYDMVSATINKHTLRVGNDSRDITDFTIHDDIMACRREGSQEVMGLSSKTYENMFSIKINEPVKSVKFSPLTNEIFIAGQDAKVYIWDLRKSSICKHKFQDDGAVHTTSLALSESSNLISIGSDSGIVNTYELGKVRESKFPTPIKTMSNLSKSIDLLEYNHTGELLLFGSTSESGAIRMVHSHSGTVYKNFPVSGKRYSSLFSAKFSPKSGYLALGSSNGRAHLIRLPYYKSY